MLELKNEKEKRQEETQILSPHGIAVIIPECCREGLDSCKHVPQKIRISKRNVGM